MTDRPNLGADDADIDLDTQQLVKPRSEEPLGYGPGEWASGSVPTKAGAEQVRTESAGSDIEHRICITEAAVEAMRVTVSSLEREVAIVRADLERLRQESERIAGSKMP